MGLFVDAEEVSIEDSPGVVGCEFRGSFGSFHHDWGADTTVETGETFVFDNLFEAVDHRGVVVLTGDRGAALELDSSFDDVERIPWSRLVGGCAGAGDEHEKNLEVSVVVFMDWRETYFRDTSYSTSCELVLEW